VGHADSEPLEVRPKPDRRQAQSDRRKIVRGGRRATDIDAAEVVFRTERQNEFQNLSQSD
jgi:hypothetical protein